MCVRACVRACVCACVRACVRLCVGGRQFRTSSIGNIFGNGSTIRAAIRIGSIIQACDDLPQTGRGRVLNRGEVTQSQGCGADSSGMCSPVGVRQLLEDAIQGSGFCLGLRNVAFVREGTV